MTESVENSKPLTNTRHFKLASAAAMVGCIACCLGPPLAALGLGSSALAATLASVSQPGSELIVGGLAFAATLGA